MYRVEEIADEKGLTTDFSSLRSSISKLQKASTALDKEKEIAEKRSEEHTSEPSHSGESRMPSSA